MPLGFSSPVQGQWLSPHPNSSHSASGTSSEQVDERTLCLFFVGICGKSKINLQFICNNKYTNFLKNRIAVITL